jgi:hypothetical protein
MSQLDYLRRGYDRQASSNIAQSIFNLGVRNTVKTANKLTMQNYATSGTFIVKNNANQLLSIFPNIRVASNELKKVEGDQFVPIQRRGNLNRTLSTLFDRQDVVAYSTLDINDKSYEGVNFARSSLFIIPKSDEDE